MSILLLNLDGSFGKPGLIPRLQFTSFSDVQTVGDLGTFNPRIHALIAEGEFLNHAVSAGLSLYDYQLQLRRVDAERVGLALRVLTCGCAAA